MREKSHKCLGQFLVKHYMDGVPQLYTHAFMLGCIQPDKNPTTYLKGSIRHQCFRGHNYLNALGYMLRLGRRLEQKKCLKLWDYYCLGKLIHYTADAFTSAHNHHFPKHLDIHRTYEAYLQNYFLDFLTKQKRINSCKPQRIATLIQDLHNKYTCFPTDIRTDSRFAFLSCCLILGSMVPKIAFKA